MILALGYRSANSMAQMPVPVPTSSTFWGLGEIGAKERTLLINLRNMILYQVETVQLGLVVWIRVLAISVGVIGSFVLFSILEDR
jgi:hypothetical protein